MMYPGVEISGIRLAMLLPGVRERSVLMRILSTGLAGSGVTTGAQVEGDPAGLVAGADADAALIRLIFSMVAARAAAEADDDDDDDDLIGSVFSMAAEADVDCKDTTWADVNDENLLGLVLLSMVAEVNVD